MARFKIGLDDSLDPALQARVEAVFAGENIIEMVLHAHLLIERALTKKISVQLRRPDIFERDRWSFHQKLSLYIGLFNPPEDQEALLRAFNRLRNAIAHHLGDEAEAVRANLPSLASGPPPQDPLALIRACAFFALLNLDGVIRIERLEEEARSMWG
jgi:hypothetical protein